MIAHEIYKCKYIVNSWTYKFGTQDINIEIEAIGVGRMAYGKNIEQENLLKALKSLHITLIYQCEEMSLEKTQMVRRRKPKLRESQKKAPQNGFWLIQGYL